MATVKSINGVAVRLSQERWAHIIERHPEMENQKDKVLLTLDAPDLAQEGDLGTLLAAKFYSETPLTQNLW